MSVTSTDSAELKAMIKAAMAETLAEQRGLLYEMIEEALEDIGLVRAMEEGLKSPPATREEVFAALDRAE